MATAKVRQAPVYALYAKVRNPVVRSAPHYVLYSNSSPLPLNVTGQTGLLNLLQENTDKLLDEGIFEFGPPEVSDQYGCNTRVLVAGKYGSGLLGSMYFYYNRAAIKRVYLDPSFLIAGETNVHSMLARIREASKMVIQQIDVVNSPVVGGKVQMTAADTSYFFLPGSTLELVSERTVRS